MTFWDDNATPAGVFNVGDMYHTYTRRQAAFIVEQLDIQSGFVADIGCGIGRLSFEVAHEGPGLTVVGIDPSFEMIQVALERLQAYTTPLSHRLTFGVFKGDRLWEGADPFYDGAWCVLTFQHLPDDTVKQHLKDLFEILKPGARLVTQWVTSGEEAPMSYPRDWLDIFYSHRDAGFDVPTYATDEHVTKYADNWLWVVAEKPA